MAATLAITTLLLLTVTTLFVAPAAAQDDDDDDDPNFCENDIMVWIRNATGFLTVAGPSTGILNAGWNMLKASGSNKSNSIKEAKGNIKTALMFGFGLGALGVISGLITTWGPVSACSF
jgi:acid phosphatase family membrane protein YuiD